MRLLEESEFILYEILKIKIVSIGIRTPDLWMHGWTGTVYVALRFNLLMGDWQ